jgi:hypothetical protein
MQKATLLRVFPRKTKWTPTDGLAFVGDPPLMRPDADEVHVSATFTWDIPEAKRLQRAWSQYYPNVRLGGPALGDPGGAFCPGRYIKEGVVFTSRGCRFRCAWCFVPEREGLIRELPITHGWIVQDNNLLACSRPHIEAVFEMLRGQRHRAVFSGGWDIRLLRPWHVDLLKSIRLGEVWVACDSADRLPLLVRASEILAGIPTRKRRCYALVGFGDDTLEDAETRLSTIYGLGFLPFAQLYRAETPREWPAPWRALARKWSRPAAYRSAA